ncbi:MAG: T9SS type A sorting domain-containing protein [Flavobacteriales bacterium]|nr:T9SS type A sorting domain-containing protein [Flavobacteriales bacterium]
MTSLLPREDGKVLVAGMIGTAAPPYTLPNLLLNHDGSRDLSWPPACVAGKITLVDDKVYSQAGDGICRIFQDGSLDTSFHFAQNDNVHVLQAGDYYVRPDGRIMISGVQNLYDDDHDYLGLSCLAFLTNEGYLDTTASPRTCAGSLNVFSPLPNGQFIGSGSTGIWDGHQASNIIRFNADGSLDSSFQAHVWWGEAYGFLPLPDGKVYAGGNFRITGIADTLNLVRFMPDGSLDPTFNNTAKYRDINQVYPNNPPEGIVRTIHPLSDDQLIVTGNFGTVDGNPRGGITLINSTGNLMDTYFSGNGCGGYLFQPGNGTIYYRVISGIKRAPDGSYYIWGAYNGYDDGTTNDTLQRFVSRLHGLNVGINEQSAQPATLQIAPNPSHCGAVQLSVGEVPKRATLTVHDASGRVVLSEAWPAGSSSSTLAPGVLAPGTYVVRVQPTLAGSAAGGPAAGAVGRLVVMP